MLQDTQKRWFELALLFLIIPVGLILPLPPLILLIPAVLAVIYCLFLMNKGNKLTRSHLLALPKKGHYQPIFMRIAIFMLISTLLVWWLLPEKLFFVIRENPLMWLGISIFYTVVSVYPQELIYRHFFYWRYSHLLSPSYFLILNAVLFSLAHTMFMNNLVFALTLA